MKAIVLTALLISGFDVYSDGDAVHLLAGRAGEAAPRLVYSRLEGEAWSEPVSVAGAREPYRAEQGDIQLAAAGSELFAVWSATGTGPMKSGPLAAAASSDGGRTWSAAPAPSRQNETGRRFADLARGPKGWEAVWLDRAGAASLRHSAFDGKGWSVERTVDPSTCECCWNTLAVSGAQRFALYRDAAPRDLAFAWSPDGKRWRLGGSVGAFNWAIQACPHAGGGLSADGDLVHALVWNGDDAAPGVYHAKSRPPYKAWTKPFRLGGPNAKYADIAARGGKAAAVWSESDAVYCALSADDGTTWSEPRKLSKNRASRPRVVAAKGGFTAVWLERSGEEQRLGWARL